MTIRDRIATKFEQAELANARGDEIQANALANSKRVTVDALDIASIPWSPAPLYGHAHSQQVSMLAYEIGTTLGLTEADLEAVKIAGLLHDVGRTQPWHHADPGHQKASAEIAVRLLRGSVEKTIADRDVLRDRVEFLILGLDLSQKELPRDPALQALWDVDALESARYAPGTVEGLKLFKARTAASRVCTAYGKERTFHTQMLRHHGWQL